MVRSILLLLIISFFNYTARASHLLGGEIGYQYISSTGTAHTYRVTVKFFSDCSSTSLALPLLIGATPYVSLYNNGVYVSAASLVYDTANSDIEITPVCPDDSMNTKCIDINNPIPGIKLYTYHANFVLNGTSTEWKFQFGGSISVGLPLASNAGRTPLITNANVQAGNSLMYLEATLNNTVAQNSTSNFTTVPTPFFCINKLQTYNLGAVDPDGDLLTFDLVPALESLIVNAPPPANIAYNAPYTATAPVPSAPGTYSFNTISGQMYFNPNAAVNSVVVNRVNEIRNGVLIGTSMREMTFIILTNCPNQGPAGPIANLSNGDVDPNDPTTINACQGSGVVSFQIHASDPENDNVEISTTNQPAGSVININNNNTPTPSLSFNWNVSALAPGDYVFYVTLKDDGCPVSVTQTYAYTIRVNPTYEFGKNDVVEICRGESYLFYGNYYYATGLYSDTFTSVKGCDSIYFLNLLVNDMPDVVLNYGNGLQKIGICPSDVANIRVINPLAGATYQWYNGNSPIAGETGTELAVTNAGSYWVIGVSNKGCTDSSKQLEVIIHPQPDATIEPLPPGEICAYDTVTLKSTVTDAFEYRWEPVKPFRFYTGAESATVSGVFTEPTWVTLSVYNQFGCFDTAHLYIDAQPCCEVFVPNAFTPNNDGTNDFFKPELQPGQVLVSFQIFDRWGKMVYDNDNIKKGWNGNYPNGAAASTDVYYYVLQYTCSDNILYNKKESVSLLR